MSAPTLFRGLLDAPSPSLADHLAVHGPMPHADVRTLAERTALTGRGGAGFPTAAKLGAIAAAGRRPVVVANGAEGEPAAAKDAVLLARAPHLVLDGLSLVATSLRARSAHLAAGPVLARGLAARLAERRDAVPVRLHESAPRFLAGEESALVAALQGDLPVPRGKLAPVRERGVDGRPTLVLNVETLARLALMARGDDSAAGRALVTRRTEIAGTPWVDVAEVTLGSRIGDILRLDDDVQAVLAGGYAGVWVPAAQATRLPLGPAGPANAGAALGAGVLAALPADRCGLRETARVVAYLARQSAGQCGPCLNGLPRIAAALGLLARPGRPPQGLLEDVRRWCGLLPGRGACSHPDGSVRLVQSTLHTFEPELTLHGRGVCSARVDTPFLPVPEEK